MRAWQVQGAGEPARCCTWSSGILRSRVPARSGSASPRPVGLPDVFMCRGTYPLTPPLPFTSGQEATGTVTAVGDGVRLSVGDRIMCVTSFIGGDGSFAEECLAAADGAFLVPDGLTETQQGSDPTPHGLDRARRPGRAGQRVGRPRCGRREGDAAVQLGHTLGASVIAVVSDEEPGGFVPPPRCRGDDHTARALAAALRDLTGRAGST